MVSKSIPVYVTHVPDATVALTVARAEFEGIYSSANAELKLKMLKDDGITEESMAEYFQACAYLQFAFAEAKRDATSDALRNLGFRFGELRQLYLPVLTATVLSQIGDVDIGPYHIMVQAAADAKVNRKQVWAMSEALLRNQSILYCQKDQIGVANREVPADVMVNVIGSIAVVSPDEDVDRQTYVTQTFYGQSPDSRSCFLSMIAGIRLVDTSKLILYPFYEVHELRSTRKIVATFTEPNPPNGQSPTTDNSARKPSDRTGKKT